MKAIEVAYASAPADEAVIHTLELEHPAFPGGVFRLCNGFNDIALTLETGETVTFTAAGLGINLPERAVVGREDLAFAMDNVTGDVRHNMLAAQEQGGEIPVRYRPYLETDPTGPAQPPLVLTAVGYADDRRSATVTASFRNLMDKRWPFLLFTPAKYPGIKYA
ncbi:DUF1833 family protein [Ferrimonas pelagia]|uniref:DUF1833 domain-containing protein n=1 Tax=Ferrimonas pelagia TaxID=1177826 RepID=A0ABP9EIF8_9GAMM